MQLTLPIQIETQERIAGQPIVDSYFSGPRLGTNEKYDGNQATAIYLEVDAETLLRMFEYLSIAETAV
jgi:N-acyl-L-homoserine lactone synthetase